MGFVNNVILNLSIFLFDIVEHAPILHILSLVYLSDLAVRILLLSFL